MIRPGQLRGIPMRSPLACFEHNDVERIRISTRHAGRHLGVHGVASHGRGRLDITEWERGAQGTKRPRTAAQGAERQAGRGTRQEPHRERRGHRGAGAATFARSSRTRGISVSTLPAAYGTRNGSFL